MRDSRVKNLDNYTYQNMNFNSVMHSLLHTDTKVPSMDLQCLPVSE